MSTAIVTTSDTLQQFLAAVEARTTLGSRTKAQYIRALERAHDAGVNLRDAEQLTAYAAGLPSSSRAFLRSAVRVWAQRVTRLAKASATPDNVASTQAAVYRLEAMQDAIELEKSKGTKAHTWLTKTEVKRLLTLPDVRTVMGQRDRLVLALLVGAGLRRQEAVTLRWQNVVTAGDRRVLNVEGKGQKGRVVPISAALARMLDDWREITAGDGEDFVLRSVRKGTGRIGQSLTGTAVYQLVQQYGAALGKTDLQPHDLRRTYARIGYDSGVDIGQISLLLGHASVSTTQRYLGLEIDTSATISDFVPLE